MKDKTVLRTLQTLEKIAWQLDDCEKSLIRV